MVGPADHFVLGRAALLFLYGNLSFVVRVALVIIIIFSVFYQCKSAASGGGNRQTVDGQIYRYNSGGSRIIFQTSGSYNGSTGRCGKHTHFKAALVGDDWCAFLSEKIESEKRIIGGCRLIWSCETNQKKLSQARGLPVWPGR